MTDSYLDNFDSRVLRAVRSGIATPHQLWLVVSSPRRKGSRISTGTVELALERLVAAGSVVRTGALFHAATASETA